MNYMQDASRAMHRSRCIYSKVQSKMIRTFIRYVACTGQEVKYKIHKAKLIKHLMENS